jgi:uncharacterized protein
MSLWESGESTGDVSFRALFEGEPARGRATLGVRDYARLVVRGGWPQAVATAMPAPERFVRNYLAYAVEHAIPDASGTRHDPLRLERFLRAYAQFSAP